MRRPKQNRGGFTLLELIITLAIASIVAGAVGTFSLAWQRRTYAAYNETELQNDLRYALNVITYYLRKAQAITVSTNSLQTQVTLTLPDGKTVVFGHQKYRNTLWIKDNSLPMCSHIAQLDVITDELPLVKLQITTVDKLPGMKKGLPLVVSKQIRLRNFGK